MAKNIFQQIVLPGSPKNVYDMYMDARRHRDLTGSAVTVKKTIGSRFKAFGGMLTGKILHLVPNEMIVQTWRSEKFHKGDADSVLALHFAKVKNGTRISLVHSNVPDHDHADVNKGWHRFYWKPMAQTLRGSKR